MNERLIGGVRSSAQLARPISVRVIPLTIEDARARPGLTLPTDLGDPAEGKIKVPQIYSAY